VSGTPSPLSTYALFQRAITKALLSLTVSEHRPFLATHPEYDFAGEMAGVTALRQVWQQMY
jgi:hypothetical protein